MLAGLCTEEDETNRWRRKWLFGVGMYAQNCIRFGSFRLFLFVFWGQHVSATFYLFRTLPKTKKGCWVLHLFLGRRGILAAKGTLWKQTRERKRHAT